MRKAHKNILNPTSGPNNIINCPVTNPKKKIKIFCNNITGTRNKRNTCGI